GSKLAGRFGPEAESAGSRLAGRLGSEADSGGGGLGEDTGGICHSFAPDTPVLMADGSTKPIKDVRVGDKVTATDPGSGQTGARTVTGLHDNRDTDLADVTVVDNGRTATVHTTQHHLFWDATTGDWVPAGKLQS